MPGAEAGTTTPGLYNRFGAAGTPATPPTSFLLLEDGTSFLLLEDGTSKLGLETGNG